VFLLIVQSAARFASLRLAHWPVKREYTVGELAAGIYQIRNQIAHGDRIRAEYLQNSEFRFDPAEHHYLGVEEWSYRSLLCEAAFFALCAALRQVIVGGNLKLL
jgi:hypothetical protein